MGISYIAMLTAFYVDNGKNLPIWRDLPPVAYWLLPSAVGLPLIIWALGHDRRTIDLRGRNSAMKSIEGVGLAEVVSLYGGVQGDFLQLVFGQQIHIGGMKASMELAERAGIGRGQNGIDLCCCNGAGMRFLVRFRDVASMVGVDATAAIVERGRQRCREEGLENQIRFVLPTLARPGCETASAISSGAKMPGAM